jgi:hypothetical protein
MALTPMQEEIQEKPDDCLIHMLLNRAPGRLKDPKAAIDRYRSSPGGNDAW